MHELPITESILEIAVRHGQKANAKRVAHIYLIIGELSSVVDESVQFYWDIISQDTICEGACLHFERIPATLHCLDCGKTYKLSNHELSLCPYCESFNVQVTAGKEFRLEAIDVET